MLNFPGPLHLSSLSRCYHFLEHSLLLSIFLPSPPSRRFTSEGGSEGENPGILGKAKEKLHNAADSLEHGMDNMKEAFGGAASSLASMTGSDSGNEPINARSVWEESRSEEQKAVANANRKAQLTDEAYGTDNPSEATPRFDKDTVPDPLDTPH